MRYCELGGGGGGGGGGGRRDWLGGWVGGWVVDLPKAVTSQAGMKASSGRGGGVGERRRERRVVCRVGGKALSISSFGRGRPEGKARGPPSPPPSPPLSPSLEWWRE